MSKPGLPRIAVLGGGPVGLEAALYARSLDLPVALYEQGQPGEFVGRWGFTKMFTPFGMNASTLGRRILREDRKAPDLPADTEFLTGKEYRERYLVPLAACPLMTDVIKSQTAILGVGRTGWRKTDTIDPRRPLPPFRILARGQNNAERFDTADVILDCTGTYGRPNWIGDGGLPAAGEIASRPQIAYWLEDVRGPKKPTFAGKTIILIGSGYSAATTACELSELANENSATWVIWLAHGSRTQPLTRVSNDPLRERDRLAAKANHLAARGDGNIEYHAFTQLDEMVSHGPDKGFRVVGKVSGKAHTWDVDRVIANVGYRPDMTLCAELRIAEPAGDIHTGEPGYYILGAKSQGRDSGFLIRDAHEQIRMAFNEILGKHINQYTKAS